MKRGLSHRARFFEEFREEVEGGRRYKLYKVKTNGEGGRNILKILNLHLLHLHEEKNNHYHRRAAMFNS